MSCGPNCPKKLTGRQSHCGACHRTFTGLHGFDKHRLGGKCLDPTTRGMTEKSGLWGEHGTSPGWWGA